MPGGDARATRRARDKCICATHSALQQRGANRAARLGNACRGACGRVVILGDMGALSVARGESGMCDVWGSRMCVT